MRFFKTLIVSEIEVPATLHRHATAPKAAPAVLSDEVSPTVRHIGCTKTWTAVSHEVPPTVRHEVCILASTTVISHEVPPTVRHIGYTWALTAVIFREIPTTPVGAPDAGLAVISGEIPAAALVDEVPVAALREDVPGTVLLLDHFSRGERAL